MNHPYSGTASYIYANEYPYTPVDPHHNDPYSKMESFNPIQSVESLPLSDPYSPQNTMTWTTGSIFTQTQTQSQLSVADELLPHARSRPDSQRTLLPVRARVAHPYSQVLSSSLDDESVVETPVAVAAKLPELAVGAVSTRPMAKRTVTIREAEAPVRRSAFVPYEPRPFEEERERERERDRARLASAWRRKIKRRVKRALRRLRRYWEGL
ncbi:hypothetical protein B0H19DRAFT_712666 [Mycena capillaripes]|nr:hypothetical protein B0H19DRAFT_712666 [Mycena capillaripes]